MGPRRYELSDFEWSIIQPLLPNKPRGVPRVDDRRVLNGIYWRLLRHGFGVAAVSAGVPLNLVQKWLGHAQLTTTAIYADAVGAEEKDIARRMWGQEFAVAGLYGREGQYLSTRHQYDYF